ncbi:(deoxy)nucleoside triphosphate pyrophosphohydrolase [Pelagibacteraceae bacterium]|nr:(deoxy)nucleoside triphosphate pyrophosphohydrolase [Pelagibacteraceae bacterium]
MKKIDVVAAIISRNDKFFIAQRNKNKHMGLSWEFPGGKVEEGESFETALKREIKEELNIEIDVKDKLGEENYQDEKINVKLHYFICSILRGEICLNEHEDSAWISKNEFLNYDFAEGDRDIISLL